MGWSEEQAAKILLRGDRDICFYCHVDLNEENRTVDHVVPKSSGGSNRLENLCLACRICNRNKADRDAGEFLEREREIRWALFAHGRKRDQRGYPLLADAMRRAKQQQGIVPWDEGHEDARRRIADVKRASAHELDCKMTPCTCVRGQELSQAPDTGA